MATVPTQVSLKLPYDQTLISLGSAESELALDINTIGSNVTDQPSQATLLRLQYKMQVFSFFAEFTSTLTKKVGDVFSGIVRNF